MPHWDVVADDVVTDPAILAKSNFIGNQTLHPARPRKIPFSTRRSATS
jgi:hypothetical protein